MSDLKAVEIKAFVPARDFELSKRFYTDFGFTMASDTGGVAYFHVGECSFLLQDFYDRALAENLMMHLLVEDVQAWRQQVGNSDLAGRYGVTVGDVTEQPWGMLDFVVSDPSGVLWRVAQNL
ncbi:VOC family protein [Marinobacter sp. JSM 1782161]|uniref:VOC family protein n=1 Tax=Marinobacter sp. JSM 1782161 TaxID=2685906 RepID=UPI0014033BB4|nr:VOC family protein [Marinobacter sp. JSM 1782161]